jgi:ribosomal silencing factor RsfS
MIINQQSLKQQLKQLRDEAEKARSEAGQKIADVEKKNRWVAVYPSM